MKKSALKSKTALTKGAVEQIRAEEQAAGVPENFRFPKRFKVIPKEKRREYPPEAFEPRNTKVRITTFLDLDVLDYFKARAAKEGTPYQTLVNAALREILEKDSGSGDAASSLRRAKGLIDAALRKIG